MIYYYFPFIRSAYDLSQHSKATGVRLCAEKKLAQPVTKQVTEVVPNKGPIGKAFKKVHHWSIINWLIGFIDSYI